MCRWKVHRDRPDDRWSALGLFIGHGVHAIDTGAVWGGKLTALRLDGEELRVVQVPGRDVPAMPPKPRKSKAKRRRHGSRRGGQRIA